jgi:hypothetical protein
MSEEKALQKLSNYLYRLGDWHPGYAVTNLQADHLPSGLKILTTTMKPFLSQDEIRRFHARPSGARSAHERLIDAKSLDRKFPWKVL